MERLNNIKLFCTMKGKWYITKTFHNRSFCWYVKRVKETNKYKSKLDEMKIKINSTKPTKPFIMQDFHSFFNFKIYFQYSVTTYDGHKKDLYVTITP